MKLQDSFSLLAQTENIAPVYHERFLSMFGTKEVENITDVLELYESFCLQEEKRQLQRNFQIEITDHAMPDLATHELLQHIQNLCPQCKQKTWTLTQVDYLTCSECSAPTSRPHYHIYSCSSCQHIETMRVSLQEIANKQWCGECGD